MILILEDDADREAFQRETPFVFFRPESSLRTPTVWVNVEAYEEKVRADEQEQAAARHAVQRERLRVVMRADLRARVTALGIAHNTDDAYNAAITDVLALIDLASSTDEAAQPDRRSGKGSSDD